MSIYVKQWPSTFTTSDGTIICNPSIDQCIANGYILGDDPAVIEDQQNAVVQANVIAQQVLASI